MNSKAFNIFVLIVGIACIVYWLILGIGVRFGQSMMFLWPLAGGACVLRYLIWNAHFARGTLPSMKLIVPLRIIVIAALAVFFVVEGIILAGGLMPKTNGLDYIVVLGARVNGREPSGALRNRITVAREYLEENPGTIAVLSGGQGADEEISEASCMYERLTAAGVDPARLILEDQSSDTRENIINSYRFIPEGASVGLVTNNFHMFRARGIAKGLGHIVSGVPVATSWISFPHYMMREFLAFMYEGVVKRQLGF